jgi:hypothetical protein
MPDGLAISIERTQFNNSARGLNWGQASYEEESVIARRAVFIYEFSEEELTEPIFSNPQVEVLSALPADWRYPLPVTS